MHSEPFVTLDFDSVPPFGDSPFLGNPFETRRVFDAPPPPNDRVLALSMRGVRVEHDGEVHVDVGERITLTLIHDGRALTLGATVAHVASRGFRRSTFNLVFDTLSDTQRDALVRLIAVDQRHLLVA